MKVKVIDVFDLKLTLFGVRLVAAMQVMKYEDRVKIAPSLDVTYIKPIEIVEV